MPFPFYTGNAEAPLEIDHKELTLARRRVQNDPRGYKPDEGLIDAVNVALLLGQPLLLTGEPGTGKTQLAYSLSWELGFAPPSPLVFETKSTSTARDLFYTYDTVGRFHAAQTGMGSQDPRAYISYNALGKAIILAKHEHEVKSFLPIKREARAVEPSAGVVGEEGDALSEPVIDFVHGGQRRSVVLIDEIDKAPRDFPNDILNEVEGMYFKIPEMNNVEIRADEQLRPVLILTSNSEKNLPEAFLRRCIYYNIPFPEPVNRKLRTAEESKLKTIVETRIGEFKDENVKWLNEALDLFYELRAPHNALVKKPATAELLGWLTTIIQMCVAQNIAQTDPLLLRNNRQLIDKSLSALIKQTDDRDSARPIINDWLSRPPRQF